MPRKTPFIPPLLIAFIAAIALHALVLPLAVGAIGLGEAERRLADLAVTQMDAPDQSEAGSTVNVLIAVENRGQALASSRTDRLLLSRDRQLDASDQHVSSRAGAALAPGGREQSALSATLPTDADGPYFLIAESRQNPEPDTDEPADANPSNNTQSIPIFIDGEATPELAIESFITPERGILNSTALVDSAVTNRGPGWAHGGWNDRIYLSTDDRFDVNDIELRTFGRDRPLGPEQGYSHDRVELRLPEAEPGDYYLIAVADADQVLDQPSFTAGQSARPITLVRSPHPDLAVTRIEAPSQATVGEQSLFRYTVANFGVVPTGDPQIEAPWVEGFYLSRDKVIDQEDRFVGSAQAIKQLEPSERYTNDQAVLTIPDDIEPGQWYLAVVADGGNSVDEGEFELNNAWAVPLTVVAPREATEEPPLGEPDEPDRLTVAWIEHEVLIEHMARQRQTIQPAIQSLAETVPDAPSIPDPLPPSQESIARQAAGDPNTPDRDPAEADQTSGAPRHSPPDAQDTDVAPRPQDPSTPAPQTRDGVTGDPGDAPQPREGIDTPRPDADPNPTPRPDVSPQESDTPPANPGQRPVPSPADPDAPDTDRQTDSPTPAERENDTDQTNPNETDSDQPSETQTETDADMPSENDPQTPGESDTEGEDQQTDKPEETTPKPTEDDAEQTPGEQSDPSAPSEEQVPTSRPRDPAEADPTDVNEPLRYTEGGVLVGRGIRVNTQRIRRPAAGTRLTAVPRDAAIRVVFDNQGQVIEAALTRSTGYSDWDALILESLYRWTAEGPRIDAADPSVEISMEYKFGILSGQ